MTIEDPFQAPRRLEPQPMPVRSAEEPDPILEALPEVNPIPATVTSEPTPDPAAPKPQRQPRKKSGHFMAVLDWLADKGSIIGNWVIDFALVGLGLISMAPEIWTAIVMVVLSFILATFLVRSLLRRNKGLYIMLLVLIGFFDVSYYMAFLDRQHQRIENPGVDDRLLRFQELTGKAQKALDDLLAQQDQAQNRTTLDNLDGQIRFAQSALEEATRRENDYVAGGLMSLAVDPRVLAMSIPNALTNEHMADKILLVMVIVLFVALQWTLRLAVGMTVKKARKESAPTKGRGRGRGRGKTKAVKTEGLTLRDSP